MKKRSGVTWTVNHGGAAAQLLLLCLSFAALHQLSEAQQCGKAANNTLCAGGLCCSAFGFCGGSLAYCGDGCQSQCQAPSPVGPPAVSTSGLDKTLTETVFEELFPNHNVFYTYNALILAGNAFPDFGTQGSEADRLREIAAFAAHVQQETAGLVYIREIDQSGNYCDPTNLQYPCAPNQTYYGRGPLQLSWNYNYGPAGEASGADLLGMPDLVATDPVLAFKSSLWFWTTARTGGIPSIHDVLIGNYTPTREDLKKGRKPGFGLTILIINGGLECGKKTPSAQNRIKYFKQFAAQLGVKPGHHLKCDKMTPYGS